MGGPSLPLDPDGAEGSLMQTSKFFSLLACAACILSSITAIAISSLGGLLRCPRTPARQSCWGLATFLWLIRKSRAESALAGPLGPARG